MRDVLARAALCLLATWSLPSFAHKPSDSYLTIGPVLGKHTLSAQWDIALRDLEHAVGVDRNGDGHITWGELKASRSAVERYALSHLSIEAIARGDRERCAVTPTALLVDQHVDGHYAVLRLLIECTLEPAELAVHYGLLFDLDPNHRGLLDVVSTAGTQALVLSNQQRTMTVSLSAPNRLAQLRSFLDEGIWHIWKGYDHILFLLTLLLPAVVVYRSAQWQPRASLTDATLDVLKVVTAFTVAHSITLSLAVTGVVHLPSRLVESGIALSVVLGAANNLIPVIRDRRWMVAFAFGLIHGLGFASVLTDLGLQGTTLALALIGFNAGVEVGQLAIVFALVPIAYALRATAFYRRAFMPAGAVAIGAIALYWLAIRAMGMTLQ
jgi:hypothetical protein